MKTKRTQNLVAAALTGALALNATAAFADETNHWRFDASANLFMAGLSGDVTARGIPASVDVSFGDIVKDLELGAAGRFTVGYDRWSLSTEVSYMGLGVSTRAASVDINQWLVESTVGYRCCNWFEGFAGVRYNNINGDVRFNGPLGKVATGTQDWWDPIIGAQFSRPLFGPKLTFNGRFDVGGFGVGSDLTWQAFPYLNWRFAKWGSAQLGYRWLATDYETGGGTSKFVYDVIVEGPQRGLTVHF
jgi:hypothetical protein